MLTVRELPPADWSRLASTYLEPLLPLLVPGEARILVVEDAGQIIGTWGLYRPFHVDGLWVSPDHQKKAAVCRALLTTMTEWIQASGARAVLTSAADDQVATLLGKLGASPLTGTSYLWPMKEHVVCR